MAADSDFARQILDALDLPSDPAFVQLITTPARVRTGLTMTEAEWMAAVTAFLRELADGKTIGDLTAEAESWRNSADLNEEWIADLNLRAARLLADRPGDG